jgi:hypothetical protein
MCLSPSCISSWEQFEREEEIEGGDRIMTVKYLVGHEWR